MPLVKRPWQNERGRTKGVSRHYENRSKKKGAILWHRQVRLR